MQTHNSFVWYSPLRHRAHWQSGLSLIEVLVSLAVLGVSVVALARGYSAFFNAKTSNVQTRTLVQVESEFAGTLWTNIKANLAANGCVIPSGFHYAMGKYGNLTQTTSISYNAAPSAEEALAISRCANQTTFATKNLNTLSHFCMQLASVGSPPGESFFYNANSAVGNYAFVEVSVGFQDLTANLNGGAISCKTFSGVGSAPDGTPVAANPTNIASIVASIYWSRSIPTGSFSKRRDLAYFGALQ